MPVHFKFYLELCRKLGKGKLRMDRLHLDFGFNFKKAWTQLYKTTTVYEMTGVIYYLKFVNVC